MSFEVHTNKNEYLFLFILSIFQSTFSSSQDEAFVDTPSPAKKNRREFSTVFKLKIVQAAKETSNREQGRIHSLDESIIRRWRTNESKLIEAENLPKRMVNNASPMGKKFGNRCRSIGGGRKPKCQEIEQELLSWIDEKRAKALHVSRKMIKERALIIFEEKKAKESDHFSASDGWISFRFLPV